MFYNKKQIPYLKEETMLGVEEENYIRTTANVLASSCSAVKADNIIKSCESLIASGRDDKDATLELFYVQFKVRVKRLREDDDYNYYVN